MQYIDDETKKLNWYNRNIFFSCTMFFVLVNILAFAFGGDSWVLDYFWTISREDYAFIQLTIPILSAFEHSNWQHCLLNCLCFFVAGSYVERKIGTFNLLVLVFTLTVFSENLIDANSGAYSHGFSGVNYAMYAYIIIDYIFMFINKKQTKTNIILGAITLALIYLAFCFGGGTTAFNFAWYPYDLITNDAHYIGFLTGGILTLLLQFIKWQIQKK